MELAADRHATSGRQLAFLAQRQGFTLATTTVNAIRQGVYKSAPTAETIRAIAWLAGVSDEVAFMAAGQPVPGPPFAEELPPGVDNLSLKSRKAALDMLRVLVDLEKDADEERQAELQALREERRKRFEDAGYVSSGQKIEEPDDEATLAAKRKAGAAIQAHKAGLRAVDSFDNNIPLPEDYLDLAAHPATNSSGRREHDAGRERGEESQED
ncbi:hypothetical protein [Pseudarthrobacter cellobiosi]|uniref:hypothetical protein n=1 Tax=Pseudarthrobacter cellobiosi TaxID=2953654 RepID=UPI00208E1744|nr:hypothetical protein [Pseudarthrobacter sp. HLT1-5]